jgi:torulene dioxygenase
MPSSDGSCKVIYNSRRQVDALTDHAHQIGKFDAISFGQKRDPSMSFLQKMKASLEPVSGIPVIGENKPEWANVGVTIHTNIPGYPKSEASPPETSSIANIITFMDTNIAKQIDPKTLEPTGITQQQHHHPHLVGPLSCAHTQVDPINGDIYNYNLEFGASPTYRIFRTLSPRARQKYSQLCPDRVFQLLISTHSS